MFDLFEKVYLLNLPERSDRLGEARRELERAGCTRPYDVYPAIRPSQLAGFATIGEHGCFQSHVEMLRSAVGCKSVLILEDDVQFAPNLAARAAEFSVMVGGEWDVFYGGWWQFEQVRTYFSGSGILNSGSAAEFTGTHCYAVSGSAIPLLLDGIESILANDTDRMGDRRLSVDGAINLVRRRFNLRTFAAVPPMAFQRASKSDVAHPKWIDTNPFTRDAVRPLRRVKNEVLRLGEALGLRRNTSM